MMLNITYVKKTNSGVNVLILTVNGRQNHAKYLKNLI